jgi:CheY-like chemotaxis protein
MSITLPVAAQTDDAAAPALASAADTIAVDLASLPRGNGKTILVVDDDPALLATTADQLAGLGYGIMQANNGVAALDALEREPAIRLLYTDVVMPPPWDGVALAREALARRPRLAVLFTSREHREVIEPPAKLLSKPSRSTDWHRRCARRSTFRPCPRRRHSPRRAPCG